MINKAKEIIDSKEAQTVISAVGTAAELAGKTLVGFCKIVVDTVKKLKQD
jgi:hypothetical protein